ncbi:MAG: flagellar biosynthetic protein FliR [Succinatimonas sp.]|nr:flagellar biosynthetic protein FliR [Succinatimonas sp.]MDD5869689.1 flagellar biosynthetic protein FliR [Succinatimonas sp.]
MNFLEPITLTAVAQLVWPLCRISSFLAVMFAVSGSSFPQMTRALLAFSITVCMLPNIPNLAPNSDPFTVYGIMVTIKECLIGICLGLCTLFISQAFIVAGQAVAMQTGLGFASLVDPVSGTNSPVVGQFFTVLCTLVFFSLNGHLIFFKLMLESFTTLPMGQFIPNSSIEEFLYFSGSMFKAGLAMSISAICTMLVVNFTLGVMTKAAPQLNIFSLGFAVTMIVGICVLFISLSSFMSNFTNNFNDVFDEACSLIGTSCNGIL